jgi:hypothetical protein
MHSSQVVEALERNRPTRTIATPHTSTSARATQTGVPRVSQPPEEGEGGEGGEGEWGTTPSCPAAATGALMVQKYFLYWCKSTCFIRLRGTTPACPAGMDGRGGAGSGDGGSGGGEGRSCTQRRREESSMGGGGSHVSQVKARGGDGEDVCACCSVC